MPRLVYRIINGRPEKIFCDCGKEITTPDKEIQINIMLAGWDNPVCHDCCEDQYDPDYADW